jgi:hypothetical protein
MRLVCERIFGFRESDGGEEKIVGGEVFACQMIGVVWGSDKGDEFQGKLGHSTGKAGMWLKDCRCHNIGRNF